jgi:TRAP-type mannitol/chloroaromatic compound transport system permease small subunit
MPELPELAAGGETISSPDGYNQPQPLGFHHLIGVLNAIGTVWIFAIMVLMTADVVGRNLFNTPIRGVIEIVSLSIVSIVFIQLADTLRTGKFTRADAALGALLLRRPALGRFLQGFFHLAGAAMLATMCFASWSLLVESWQNGEYLGAIGDFQAPVWIMRALIVFGSACTTITFLFLALADFRVAFSSKAHA